MDIPYGFPVSEATLQVLARSTAQGMLVINKLGRQVTNKRAYSNNLGFAWYQLRGEKHFKLEVISHRTLKLWKLRDPKLLVFSDRIETARRNRSRRQPVVGSVPATIVRTLAHSDSTGLYMACKCSYLAKLQTYAVHNYTCIPLTRKLTERALALDTEHSRLNLARAFVEARLGQATLGNLQDMLDEVGEDEDGDEEGNE